MSRSESPQDPHHVSSLLIRTSSLIPSDWPSGASFAGRNAENKSQLCHGEHPNRVCWVSALPSPSVAQRSECGGGGHVRGPAREPGRSGVGGEGFECTEHQIRQQRRGWGGGGRRKASLSPQITCITCGKVGITGGGENSRLRCNQTFLWNLSFGDRITTLHVRRTADFRGEK